MRTRYLASRLTVQLLWWARAAVALVFALVLANWVGWATGVHQLTKVFGNWPAMTPWTALLLAALGVAVLVQLERSSGAWVWAGRAAAVLAGALGVVFLAEYATGGSWGVDLLFFPDAVRALQATWPGRPSPRTSSAVVLLSVAVALMRVDRRGARLVWAVGLAGAFMMSTVAIVAYLFGALSIVKVTPSTGIGISTAICLGLLVAAAAVGRPDRNPVAWLLSRPDRAALVQLAGAATSALLLIAMLHGLLSLRGVGEEPSWVVAVLIGIGALIGVTFVIFEVERRRRLESEAQFQSVITNAPNAIAIRSLSHGVEFANQAFADILGLPNPDAVVGRLPEELLPAGGELTRKIGDAETAVMRGEVATFDNDFTVDGEKLTFQIQMFPITVQGSAFSIGLIATDVTERAQAERRLRERLEFEDFLAQAIADGRLVAFAQPIVDAHTDHIVEEELLVRMLGPEGELIAPGDFIPQAQRFGLMPTIDKFMVAQGIELARSGRRVAVNLSAETINDPATTAAITDALRQAGDLTGQISFEITESTALASMAIAEQFSLDMENLGCRLALDDFGTGYGSFNEIRGLALHSLKIDQSFVHGLLLHHRDESVVKMIVSIAKEFGLITTAEGIEDADTRTRLIELGVDQLQGYLIGAPQPANRSPQRK